MKYIKTGTALACEYVASGDRGKPTLVNVYAGNIQVQEFPAAFPVAFFIELLADENLPEKIQIEVLIGKLTKAKADITQQRIVEGTIGLIVLQPMRMEFPHADIIKVVMSCEGYQKTDVLVKRVEQGIIPA